MISMLGVGGTAQVFSLALTLLFVINDIHSNANNQVSLRACMAWPYWTFFLTFAVGNAIATLFVPVMAPELVVRAWFDQISDVSRAFAYAAIGVVSFEVIFANLTYSTTGGGDYSLRERIAKARDYAVEEAVDREIALENRRQQRRARDLLDLVPEEELNGHIFELLGRGVVGNLESEAAAENAPPRFVKCNALAARKPKETDAIVRDAKRRKGWLWRLMKKMR
jgi:hypothetical protein